MVVLVIQQVEIVVAAGQVAAVVGHGAVLIAHKEKAKAATCGVFKQQTSRLRHREGGNQDKKTNQSR